MPVGATGRTVAVCRFGARIRGARDMGTYNQHPALADIRAKLFPYTPQMYPYQFMEYYYDLPVATPDGNFLSLTTTRYISNLSADRTKARQDWTRAIKKHYDAKGWNPAIKAWVATDRDSAVFNGHGLPEEISLVCTLALVAGHKTEATVGQWANAFIGIDCNGFVNAYLSSIGLFSKAVNFHPSYVNISPPASTVDEITCDSVIVTAKGTPTDTDKDGKADTTVYAVKKNPGDKGAHILVIDDWEVNKKIFWATDQPGQDNPAGPRCILYEIVTPPANAKTKLDRVWTIRKKGSGDGGNQLVYITRRMQAH
jgi:hypothetical protein